MWSIFYTIYLSVLLKKNVGIMDELREDVRMSAETLWMIQCGKLNDCILRIRPWRNKCQRSVSSCRCCKSGKQHLISTLLDIMRVLAAFIGYSCICMFPAPSWKWVSTERQWFFVLHHWWFELWIVADCHTRRIGCQYRTQDTRDAPWLTIKISVSREWTISGHVGNVFEKWRRRCNA
jgi:hypothetical protein